MTQRNMRSRRQFGFNNNLLSQCGASLYGERMMAQSMNDNSPLSGVTALVVEDDLLLAMDLEATLVGAGAVVVDVCHTLGEAMARADADDFAVAVLDFGLGSHSVTPLARRLARRDVPFILYTGVSRGEPSLMEWRDYPIVEKPASPHRLVSAIRTILAREPPRRQGRR
jgi:DNA-binding response OmpR family regulator